MDKALILLAVRLALEFFQDIRDLAAGEELTPEQEAAVEARWDKAKVEWKAELARRKEAAAG